MGLWFNVPTFISTPTLKSEIIQPNSFPSESLLQPWLEVNQTVTWHLRRPSVAGSTSLPVTEDIFSVLDMRNPQKPPWPSSTSVLSVTRVTPFSVWSKLIFQYVWLWVKCKDLDCRFQLFFIVTGRFVSWPSWKSQKSWGVLDHLHPVNNGKQFLSSLCV